MNSRMTIRFGILGALAFAATALPRAAEAQSGSWLPWLGCWEAEAGAPADAAICVRPAEQAGAVEILRIEGDEILARELVWADGVRHETTREGCEGWEQGAFSADGRRVFLESEHVCEDGLTRRASGLMALAGPVTWLDVRVLEVGDEPTAWVQRYALTSSAPAEALGLGDPTGGRMVTAGAARVAASAALDLDDVIEASERLPAEAVEAWLAEWGEAFDLSADRLVRLADAGVPDRVIDVMVAVSYPRTFALNARGGAERAESRGAMASSRRGYADPFWDSFYYGGFGYAPWGFGFRGRYGYGYSPYGYGYSPYGYSGGFGSWGYGYRPTVIVVDRRNDDGSRGRVVRGRGYTRGSSGSSGSSGSARPSAGPSRSSGGTAGVSSGGSSGSSRPSTGRKAKRRGGGF